MITKGYLTGLVMTRGYGPSVTSPLSDIDTGSKGLLSRTHGTLTKTKSLKVRSKRTMENK